jgi:hypothetical protein
MIPPLAGQLDSARSATGLRIGETRRVRSGWTPNSSVVPESLLYSMVVEGPHENRGMLPLSTSVRLP